MANDQLQFHMKLRVYRSQLKFGPGVSDLMVLVRQTQSLTAACKTMKMSYSKAWKLIKEAEADLGISLLEGSSGGKNGGKTVITPDGEVFLNCYLEFTKEAEAMVTSLFHKYFK